MQTFDSVSRHIWNHSHEYLSITQTHHSISKAVTEAGGSTYIAGGCVRDHLLGLESKDIDLEVHHLEPETLVNIIEQFQPYKAVGKSFGVWKLLPSTPTELEVDVSLPHQDGQPAPFIGTEAACIRRDLTINAMLWNIETQQLEDPFSEVGTYRTGY